MPYFDSFDHCSFSTAVNINICVSGLMAIYLERFMSSNPPGKKKFCVIKLAVGGRE